MLELAAVIVSLIVNCLMHDYERLKPLFALALVM